MNWCSATNPLWCQFLLYNKLIIKPGMPVKRIYQHYSQMSDPVTAQVTTGPEHLGSTPFSLPIITHNRHTNVTDFSYCASKYIYLYIYISVIILV